MSKRLTQCVDCGNWTKRWVKRKQRGRCALCGIAAMKLAQLRQHLGYGQGPGDLAARRPPKAVRQPGGPAPRESQGNRAA